MTTTTAMVDPESSAGGWSAIRLGVTVNQNAQALAATASPSE